MKALEAVMSQKTTQQEFKSRDGWAVRFMYLKGFTLHQRSTLAQKLPTD